MLFQRLSRTDPERVFIAMRNNNGGTATKDSTAVMEFASASVDGVRYSSPAAGTLWGFVGIVDAATTTGAYGLVQVYGYRSTSVVFQTNTSQDTVVALIPVGAQAYLQSTVTTQASNVTITQNPIFVVLGESIASSSASATISAKIFIRAL